MPPAVLISTKVGFFGKLPSTGDFVARGLKPGLRPFLDQWLTRGVAVHCLAPEMWPDGGIRAMVKWNKDWLILLILPSTDKLGREFPFAVCRITSEAPDWQSVDIWCASVYELAANAIAKPMMADDTFQALVTGEETELMPATDEEAEAVWADGSNLVSVPVGGIKSALDELFQEG